MRLGWGLAKCVSHPGRSLQPPRRAVVRRGSVPGRGGAFPSCVNSLARLLTGPRAPAPSVRGGRPPALRGGRSAAVPGTKRPLWPAGGGRAAGRRRRMPRVPRCSERRRAAGRGERPGVLARAAATRDRVVSWNSGCSGCLSMP